MPALSEISKQRLLGAHPLLQRLFNAVAAEAPIMVLDSQRGRVAQEKAFAEGNSKAHFGQSAHNWAPSVALDVTPLPLDWKNIASFKALAVIVKKHAAALKIPVQHGGDWKFKDYPHWELTPWRDWAKQSKPFTGE